MKRLITYFILLLGATFIGLAISMHAGYVLIAYSHTVIEMTLWVAILLCLCGFFLVYTLLRSGTNIYHLPESINKFLKKYHAAKSQRYFKKGLHRLLENDWDKAESRFAQAISLQKNHIATLTAYLAAAYTTNKQHLYQKRDYYLNEAQKIYGQDSKTSLTIAITKIHLFLQSQQYEEALALICHLRQTYPNHNLLLQKLQLIYVRQKEWCNVKLLLPSLSKYKILPKDELNNLEKKVYLELWLSCLATNKEKKIKHFWRKLPRYLRYDADIATPYIEFLEKNNASKQAEKILLKILQKKWQAKLIKHYGLLISHDPSEQLKAAEKWLKHHPEEPELLLAIGKICQRQKLIGKAKYYLEQYLKHATDQSQAYYELGMFMEQLDDKDAALKFYRQACQLALTNCDK